MAESAQGVMVTIELGEDELLGAHLLARMDGFASRDEAAFDRVLRSSLRHGLADRLAGAGIAWPPTTDALALVDRVGAELAENASEGGGGHPANATAAAGGSETAATQRVPRSPAWRERNVVLCAVSVFALVVLLVGGYALHWSWTGFTANDQLWDWMHLLLLPLVLATFPLWLAFSRYMSAGRRRTLGAAVLVFAVFVLIGYVNPLTWTGFRGQTLWSWLTLIILPLSIITVRLWPQSGRDLDRSHVVGAAVICAALVTTIIGGYWAGWSWTGYEGNTVWDWLTLILAPAAVTTILAPALARRLTGAADQRAERDREQAARELALRAARERLAQR
jgi:hypothetical protein